MKIIKEDAKMDRARQKAIDWAKKEVIPCRENELKDSSVKNPSWKYVIEAPGDVNLAYVADYIEDNDVFPKNVKVKYDGTRNTVTVMYL